MSEELFTPETPFLTSGDGRNATVSTCSSDLVLGGKADSIVIVTICGAVDASGGDAYLGRHEVKHLLH